MSADLVWTTGGDRATTFHDIPTGGRHTGCGSFTGFSGGEVSVGQLLPRAEAQAAGLKECGRCYGHAERKSPSVGEFHQLPRSRWLNG